MVTQLSKLFKITDADIWYQSYTAECAGVSPNDTEKNACTQKFYSDNIQELEDELIKHLVETGHDYVVFNFEAGIGFETEE